MKLLRLLPILALAMLFSCEQAPEWTDITPGPGLEGWTIVPIPPDAELAETPQWSVNSQTGIVRCDGTGSHDWLRYDTELEDFVFHVEWKFEKLEEDAKYNSGVYVRNSKDGKVWHQAQMGDGSGGFLFGNSLVGGKMARVNTKEQLDKLASNPVKPAGEWNTFELTCQGNEISLMVNGKQTTIWPNLEVRKGYLGLEAEGYAVQFRNLKMRSLEHEQETL
jgi:hypothetical protein